MGVLASAIGRPEWATSAEYGNFEARLAHRAQLTRDLDEIFSGATTREWVAQLAGKVPVAAVNDIAHALESPFVKEQQRIMEAAHPARGTIQTIACPVRCPDEPDRVGIAPTLGEHTAELLRELGNDEERIRRPAALGAL